MTKHARQVLDDCRESILELRSAEMHTLRRRWVATIVLLWAVGHVLANVDRLSSPAARRVIDRKWKELNDPLAPCLIFAEFIDKERNNVVKAYGSSIWGKLMIAIGGHRGRWSGSRPGRLRTDIPWTWSKKPSRSGRSTWTTSTARSAPSCIRRNVDVAAVVARSGCHVTDPSHDKRDGRLPVSGQPSRSTEPTPWSGGAATARNPAGSACSALNDGLPSSSKATTSPSITVSFGSLARSATMLEYRRAKSLSLRERR